MYYSNSLWLMLFELFLSLQFQQLFALKMFLFNI